MFTLWFSASMSIGNLAVGTTGPAFYKIGLQDSVLIILVVNVIVSSIPAYFAVFGPRLGTRAMVQARFSWGVYGGAIPSALNVISQHGWLITSYITGGQLIASVSDDLTPTIGIVIIGIITFIITFCGYRVIHWVETIAWIPSAVSLVALLAAGGKHLTTSAPGMTGLNVSNVVSLVSVTAANQLTWCALAPDYGVHHDAEASSLRIFTYSYLGYLLGTVLCRCIVL